MKTLAVFLSLALLSPAYGQPAGYPDVTPGSPVQTNYPNPEEAAPLDVSRSSQPVSAIEPFVITAPHIQTPEEAARVRRLKATRATGEATAASGTGLMTYAVFFGAAGPVGWAAGLMFLGGMTAYLSHRRLKGKDDFGATNAVPVSASADEP